MIYIKVQKAALFSLFISSALFADIHDRIEYKLNRVLRDVDIIINGNAGNCTPIDQRLIDQGSGIFTADHSGDYCVTEDVVGTIVLASHNVCLDLGCHQLNAGGADVAIQVQGNDCSIRNGTVTGASGATSKLISVASVNGFHLNDVHFSDFQSFGFYGDTLTNFVVENCIFTRGGEPIFITGSHVGQLNGHSVFGNINRETSNNGMIELVDCECIEVRDVKICGNSKNYIVPQLNTTSGGFFIADSSNNISLYNVHINNTQPDVANPGSAVQVTIFGAVFFSCNSIVVQDSTFSTKNEVLNYNTAGLVLYFSRNAMLQNVACYEVTNPASSMAIALGCVIVASSDVAVYSSQFNRSTCPDAGSAGMFVIAGSSSISLTDCQFSENNAGAVEGVGLAFFESTNCAATNCVAYGNASNSMIVANGSGHSVVNCSGDARFMLDSLLNCSFESVNIHNNASGSAFEVSNSQALVFENCVATGCTSGNGFLFFNTNSDIEFEGCKAEKCAGSGFSINDPVSSILLKSSQALSNAIFGFQIPANASNNTIANCVALNNTVSNYSVDVPAPLIFTVDNAGAIVGVSDYFHNLSRI